MWAVRRAFRAPIGSLRRATATVPSPVLVARGAYVEAVVMTVAFPGCPIRIADGTPEGWLRGIASPGRSNR
jgi:hypothetical protein